MKLIITIRELKILAVTLGWVVIMHFELWFVFLHETLKKDAETTEECGSIAICDENYFVDVRLLVCY